MVPPGLFRYRCGPFTMRSCLMLRVPLLFLVGTRMVGVVRRGGMGKRGVLQIPRNLVGMFTRTVKRGGVLMVCGGV